MFTKKTLATAMSLGMAGHSLSQISEQVGVKRSTLNDWLNKARDNGLALQDVSELAECDLKEILFSTRRLPADYYQPDWTTIVLDSKKPTVTKNSLWLRYKKEVPKGAVAMSRSTFFREIEKIDAMLTPEMQHIAISYSYVPGKISMVDYSGDPVHYWCSGRKKKAQLFVATVPATSYTFAYATKDQSRASHLLALKEFFRFLGGVTDEVWCDNTKSLVDKADKADPVINSEFRNFCEQYGTVPYAVEPGKPRQKASVENAVKLMQKCVIPELERRRLGSIDAINEHLPALLDEFNSTPYSEMPETSRTIRFMTEEKPTLNELPMFEYEPGYVVKNLKVSNQNQVRILDKRIPVFYGHIGDTVRVFFNKETGHVRIHDISTGEKIGERHIHKKAGGPVLPTTPDEMPEAFKRYVEGKKALLERIRRELGEDAYSIALLISRPSNSYAIRYLNAMIIESHKFTAENFSDMCRNLKAKGPVTYTKFKSAVSRLVAEGKATRTAPKEDSKSMRGADHYRELVRAKRQTTCREKVEIPEFVKGPIP